jgi:hypothetical protein
MTNCYVYLVHKKPGLGDDLQVNIVAKAKSVAFAWLTEHYDTIAKGFTLMETIYVHVVISESP